MALHERLTDAAEYGALSSPNGLIAVSWTLHSRDDGGDLLDLASRERGDPEVAPPTREGFGTRLIERQLPMEFDGTAEITYAAAGVSRRLRIPLTALGWVGQELVAGRNAP